MLFLEPFYGGSHKLFADRVRELSRHEVELLTLPGSFWKWRMRGAHLSLRRKVRERASGVQLILATDMLSLAELKGVVPEIAGLPSVVYFHENQVSYPVPKGEAPDVHFGFTNLSTALAADRLVFNSAFHRDEFLRGSVELLAMMPDRRPGGVAALIREKCEVVYPGVDVGELERHRPPEAGGDRPLTILWNHRWEFDKQPEVFFGALRRLAEEGLPFRVHLAGENFQARPKPFEEAREFLGERLLTYGYRERRGEYLRLLWESDVVVSTAIQEFYGIAVMEAARCGCRPLLPARLVYPELYPGELLYRDDGELVERLRTFCREGLPGDGAIDALRVRIDQEQEARLGVARLDDLLESLVSRPRS